MREKTTSGAAGFPLTCSRAKVDYQGDGKVIVWVWDVPIAEALVWLEQEADDREEFWRIVDRLRKPQEEDGAGGEG